MAQQDQSSGFSLGGFFNKAADFYIQKERAKMQATANPATATQERNAVAQYSNEDIQNVQARPWGAQDFANSLGQANPYLGLNNGLLLVIAGALAFYLFNK